MRRTAVNFIIGPLIAAGLATSGPTQAQDAAAGRSAYLTYCSACHAVQPNRNLTGPTLFGVVNRPSGHVQGFSYSEANRRSGLTWDTGTLDRYLTAPRQVVPGTLMSFPGVKDPTQRANLIAYLATLR